MDKERLFTLLEKKNEWNKLKYYVSHTHMEDSVNSFIDDIDEEINSLLREFF